MQVFYSTPLGSHTLPELPMVVPGNLALTKSHQISLFMINSLLDSIVCLKTTSLPAQAPSDVCLEPKDWSEVLMLVWASLCGNSVATAIHCMSANLLFPHDTPAFSIPVGRGQVQSRVVPQVLCIQCYRKEHDDEHM